MISVITFIGLEVGTLLGGAIVTETIFAWPGIGRLMVESIHRRDYPVIQAGVLLLAFNLLGDVLRDVADPHGRALV